tara:strand:+ start:1663 stop:1941 length:279 start_codon:yes stop_codon:yes gene_type:complete
MEQLINLINEISSNDEMETVINAIKKKQKELKAEFTLNALKTFEVGDKCLCRSSDGLEEATIEKINKTTANIDINGRKYNAPLSILSPMEVQ